MNKGRIRTAEDDIKAHENVILNAGNKILDHENDIKRLESDIERWRREDELSGMGYLGHLRKSGKTDQEILDIYLHDPEMMKSLGIGEKDRYGLMDIIDPMD